MSRPAPRFHNFVGHKDKVDYLRRQLSGAQARGEPFPHSLFIGPSGTGKTLLARALAIEYGTQLFEVMGYEGPSSLTKKLVVMNTNDFLFVDECHRLPPLGQELLCEAIDSNSIPNTELIRAKDGNAEAVRIALKPWTLVLATDQPGILVDALHKRIGVEEHLAYYKTTELKEIVEAMASDLNMLISPQAARRIADIAAGLPRRAKQQLMNLRLYFPDAENRPLSLPDVRDFVEASGMDDNGLMNLERTYLEIVKDLGGASLDSIALSLGTDGDYVRRQIEPTLIRRRLVRITSAGRQITPQGQELIRGSTEPSLPATTQHEIQG